MELSKGNIWHNAAREYVLFPGNYLLHKTTRAGCTTGIVAECVNQHKKLLFVGPTNAICKETVLSGMKYSNRSGLCLNHIEPNSSCTIFQNLVDEYPSLKYGAKVVPLNSSYCAHKDGKKVEYCDWYEECPITKFLRTPNKYIDVVTVTHQKFVALQIAYENYQESLRKYEPKSDHIPPIAVQIYIKLMKFAEVVLYDECHYLEKPVEVKLGLFSRNNFVSYAYIQECLDGFNINLPGGQLMLPLIADVLSSFNKLLASQAVLEAFSSVKEEGEKEDYWKLHLCETIKNPSKYIFVDDNGKPLDNQAAGLVGFFQEMIEAIMQIDRVPSNENGNSGSRLSALYDMVKIITSDILKVPALRKGDFVNVNLCANTMLNNEMTSHFLSSIQDGTKSIILTSATIGEHNYSQYFNGEYTDCLFGGNGDPMHTNTNMLILCDHKKIDNSWGKYGFWQNLGEIANTILSVIQNYGDNDVIIITKSKSWAEAIENALSKKECDKKVIYYGGRESIGVAHDARVMVAIGMAEKPSNLCDALYDDNVVSKNMRKGIVHADTWQGISRAKDPLGKTPSLVIQIGVTENDTKCMTTWGSNRKVTIDVDNEVHVTCGQYIPGPKIERYKSNENMLTLAAKFKKPLSITTTMKSQNVILDVYKEGYQPVSVNEIYSQLGYLTTVIESNFPLEYSSGKNECITVPRYLLNKNIIGRTDMYSIFDEEGSSDIVRKPLTEDVLQSHVDGKQTIGVCMLRPDNTVSCMYFGIKGSILQDKKVRAQMNMNTICNYLDSLDTAEAGCYRVEACGDYSFRIWIFFKEPQKARDVRNFGKGILKELNIDDVEVYPKTCMIKRGNKGDLVPLPRIVSVDPIISIGNYSPEATALN